MFVRKVLVLALCVGAFGCAREEGARVAAADAASGPAGAQALPADGAGTAAMVATAAATIAPRVQGFASLPDRGELVDYRKDTVRARGAYTWYRADVSEAHALAAIASGHLRVPTPDGRLLDFKYDRHVEHASGDWTWIGHLVGNDAVQTVLTFGARAAFGSIGQPDQRPLRMTMRDGRSWMVATDAAKLAKVVGRYTAEPDYLLVPAPKRTSGQAPRVGASALVPKLQEANASGTIVDVLVGYSPGLVTAYGSKSAALTRINYLVDFTNQAYVNSSDTTSQLGRVRLVGTMQVTYRDDEDNTDTLHKLSGYDSNTGKEITPDPAFNALRAARETYGADLVSFVHDFRTPQNDSCGVAWLIGGGKQGIDPNAGWDYLGYSVVSDGSDVDEGDSGNYFCEDHTFAHELGHNMGLAHDRQTAMGGDGVLDNPDDYGVSDYSFGYKRSAFSGGLYTVMAYGDAGQTSYNIFSNPRKTTFCGSPCGVAKGQPQAADAALSLSETMPLIANFRASTIRISLRNDFNGDGRSDILWRNGVDGRNTIWQSGNSATSQSVATANNFDWKLVGVGDFNGDAKADILWRNTRDGRNSMWWSADASTAQMLTAIGNVDWIVAGVADFDGDGRADILWRNRRDGRNTIWKSANVNTPQSVATAGISDWALVATADFDGDGKADILWRNARDGRNSVWWSANATTAQLLTAITNLDWIVGGVGDFDGDGKADILWHNNRDGRNTIWRSANASTPRSVTTITNLDWVIADTGDYDGNGTADLLWRNVRDGRNTIWKSAVSSTQQSVTTLNNMAWRVVHPTL